MNSCLAMGATAFHLFLLYTRDWILIVDPFHHCLARASEYPDCRPGYWKRPMHLKSFLSQLTAYLQYLQLLRGRKYFLSSLLLIRAVTCWTRFILLSFLKPALTSATVKRWKRFLSIVWYTMIADKTVLYKCSKVPAECIHLCSRILISEQKQLFKFPTSLIPRHSESILLMTSNSPPRSDIVAIGAPSTSWRWVEKLFVSLWEVQREIHSSVASTFTVKLTKISSTLYSSPTCNVNEKSPTNKRSRIFLNFWVDLPSLERLVTSAISAI